MNLHAGNPRLEYKSLYYQIFLITPKYSQVRPTVSEYMTNKSHRT